MLRDTAAGRPGWITSCQSTGDISLSSISHNYNTLSAIVQPLPHSCYTRYVYTAKCYWCYCVCFLVWSHYVILCWQNVITVFVGELHVDYQFFTNIIFIDVISNWVFLGLVYTPAWIWVLLTIILRVKTWDVPDFRFWFQLAVYPAIFSNLVPAKTVPGTEYLSRIVIGPFWQLVHP